MPYAKKQEQEAARATDPSWLQDNLNAMTLGLQWIAALPIANHSLFATEPVLEFDMSLHPFREYLTDAPLRQQAGWVDVPVRPGLGVEVSQDVLRRFRV